MAPCGTFVIDIGPVLGNVLQALVTIASVYFGVTRLQSIVKQQQTSDAAGKAADKVG